MKKNKTIWICLGVFTVLLMLLSGCTSDSGTSDNEFTISGTITAPNNTAIDSDVNDILTNPVSNDTIEDAQELPNPVIVGGYVNTLLSGDSGNSYLDGDQSDFYRISLTGNENITLYIAEYETDDLDLYLYSDVSDTVIAESVGIDYTESLQAPSAGTYIIEVRAYYGFSSLGSASNYILTTGHAATSATVLDERLQDEFVPGEIIVRFQEHAQVSIERGMQSSDDTLLGLKHKAGAADREMLLGLNQENRQHVFRTLNIASTEQNRQLFQAADTETQLKLDTLRTIEALNQRSDVVYAEPNYIRRVFEVPGDDHYPKQWHYPLISLPEAWEITTGSSDIVVAVVDTGILVDHPDINSSQLTDGYDFIRSTDISVDGDGIDSDPDDPGDQAQGGSSFHGTHVAGTIAAATDNATGVSGVSWNSKIMPLRALGNGGGSSYDIMQAIKYAAGLTNDSGATPSKAADIINLSLGGSSRSQSEQDTINTVRTAGVIIIAAAGNENTSDPSFPAAYNGVISVSAVGADKSLAPYSNYGSTIDIAAPGGDMSQDLDNDGYGDGVLSTAGDDSSGDIQMVYNFSNGTSMAAPHMAGVAALMKSVYSGLTPDILDSMIQSGDITEDLSGDGATVRNDSFGYGLINAYSAVIQAQKLEGTPVPGLLSVSPVVLNFGASQTSATLTAKNLGDESLSDVSPSEDADWLEVTEDTIDSDGLGTYTVSVDKTGLADGPYAAVITFASSENTVSVSVSMQVGTSAVAGNAGYHYVLLIDPVTSENVAQVDVATTSNGTYAFTLQAPAGNYIIFAGTDSDNDFYIGDSGESSGMYISMDQPVEITLNQNLSGYNFISSFNLNLPSSTSAYDDTAAQPVARNEIYRISK